MQRAETGLWAPHPGATGEAETGALLPHLLTRPQRSVPDRQQRPRLPWPTKAGPPPTRTAHCLGRPLTEGIVTSTLLATRGVMATPSHPSQKPLWRRRLLLHG